MTATACCSSHVPNPPSGELWPAPWLGEGRMVASCCDPDDCGPCCPQCPTCPTENRPPVATPLGDSSAPISDR